MRRYVVLGLIFAAVMMSHRLARAQACVLDAPHVEGEWRTLPYFMPINPISTTLLHDGTVLVVAGSENDALNNGLGSEAYRAAIWNPTGVDSSSITVQNIEYDVFCSGTALLPDGRAMVVGGTSDYTFTGESRASIFDPATRAFVQMQHMTDGRWYATATTLGDGRVMAWSGLDITGATSRTAEIYDLANAGAGWGSPITGGPTPPLYPKMFVLPNGTVFFTGHGSGTLPNAWLFDPAARTWTSSVPTTGNRTYGAAVLLPLLPPLYTPQVMNFGGGNPGTPSTEIIDLSAASPSWRAGPSMSSGRIQLNAVLLPNGKVLIEGGSQNNESPSEPGRRADLYDPVTNTMGSASTAAYARLYHAVALLLPDATVMSAGSNPSSRGSYEPAIEIYTPAYLFDANDRLITTNRPSITGITPSGVINYGSQLSIGYSSVSPISSAVLVRPGSTTHTFDMDQRLIGLCGPSPQPACTTSGPGVLSVTMPPNGNIAPPGYYMLFLLDGAGVPSTARFIQLSARTTTPPSGTISAPAADVTIPVGGSVSFATTTSAAGYSWVFPGGSPSASTLPTPPNVTYGAPGSYVASLTTIDGSGNSDPSPPTRTITVLPASPDFDIEVSPASRTVLPGQSATFTVTVTPLGGFTGTVNLSVASESGFPAGVTSGGFSPSAITGGGSATLTMNTTTSATPYALSLTVTGANPRHIAATTLTIELAPPTTLVAAPGDTQIALSWIGSSAATSYLVKRSTFAGGPYRTIACPTSTSFTDSSLVNGTTYYYVVTARFRAGPNLGGESAFSNEASATPQGAPPPPPPPVLPAPPTGLTASAVGKGNPRIKLQWVQSTTPGVTTNRVYRRLDTGTYPATPIATLTATTQYFDSAVSRTTRYCYVVTAVNGAGESGRSNEACATTR